MRKRVAVSGVGVVAVMTLSVVLNAQTAAPARPAAPAGAAAASGVPDLSGDWAMRSPIFSMAEASARV